MKCRISLILTVVFLMCVPVKAQEMKGDTEISAAGQTAVTARVEMPDEVPQDSENSTDVKTGDESEASTYVSLLMMSAMVIIASKIRRYKAEDNLLKNYQ